MTFTEWCKSKGITDDNVSQDWLSGAEWGWAAAIEQDVWKKALDHELTTWGMATPEDATFEQALDKLRQLLYITESVATDPSVNGGYVLVPVEPTEEMLSYGETRYLDPDPPTDKEHVKHIYRMMLLGSQESE